jgi:uncharacterized protein YjgD (DUF1641 family)
MDDKLNKQQREIDEQKGGHSSMDETMDTVNICKNQEEMDEPLGIYPKGACISISLDHVQRKIDM